MSSGVVSDPKDSKSFLSYEENFLNDSIEINISYMKVDDIWNRDSYLLENDNESVNADAFFILKR